MKYIARYDSPEISRDELVDGIMELGRLLDDAEREILAYQVRVDNDALRYARLEEIHNECFGG